MRKHKISIEKVQKAFNDAIKRHDKRCMVKDYEPCCGQLECSHFFTVGSSPSLRFFPPNAYTQCQKHHWKHHNDREFQKVDYYGLFMEYNHGEDLDFMERARHKYIKYDDELKAEIIRLCNEDKLEELKKLIEEKLS